MSYQQTGVGVAGFPNSASTVTNTGSQVTVPGGQDWEVYSLYVVINTSGTAGNRNTQVKILDGNANIVKAVTWSATTPASKIQTFNTVEDGDTQTVNLVQAVADVTTPMRRFIVPSGYSLIVNDDANIDHLADKYNFVVMYNVWQSVPDAAPIVLTQPNPLKSQ